MSNPYNTPGNAPQAPIPGPTPDRRGQGPRWARKRFVLPALGLVFLLGVGIGGSGQGDGKDAVAADPAPTATVTATATATATVTSTVTATPEPAATVTVRATRTVTAEPAVDTNTGSDTGSDDGSGSGDDSVYYANCTAARAAGAAPVRVGDPGYGRHLDRDGDGVGCE
ncbi:excalibur calcium-binding domain-containing protein [Streptomyces sp. NBC_00459]|uniref:excalibur calcium-binding domain-containing protein n=1 Tax=Streptomyces sp. NBC_00459 TaxID=2975749 RepID=UPI002E18A0EC